MTQAADTTPDVQLPAGVNSATSWSPDPVPHRDVYGFDRTVSDHPVLVYPYGVQLSDGRVDLGQIAGPGIRVDMGVRRGLGSLNSDQARELASALLEAAAEVDGWVGRDIVSLSIVDPRSRALL